IRIVFDDGRADEPRLSIEHKERGRRFGWHGHELRVDVTVPLGALVSCDTGSADLQATGRSEHWTTAAARATSGSTTSRATSTRRWRAVTWSAATSVAGSRSSPRRVT